MHKRLKDHILGWLYVKLWNQCWKITKSKIHKVVADNASNMKKALREGHFEAQGCFTHTLQLVVNDGVFSQHAVIM